VHQGEFNLNNKRWDPRCEMQQNSGFWENVIDKSRQEIGNYVQAEPLYKKRGLGIPFSYRPDIGKLTNSNIDYTGRCPRHWINPWGQWKGGGSSKAGGGGSWEGSNVKFSCNDGTGWEGRWEAMDATSDGESSARCKVHRGRDGAVGRMVAGFNQQLLDSTVKKIRICAWSRRLWNSNIKERQCTVG